MKVLKQIGFILVLILSLQETFAQSCTDTYPGGARNLSTLSGWSCSGGGSAPTSAGSYVENVTIGTLGNGDNLTMNISITLTGNLTVNSNAHTTITIPSGVTVKIIGNLTDANNNVTFDVNGTLIVTGTLSSDNNAIFSGTGSISGGTLSLGNGATCSGGCPNMTFAHCSSGGSFCNNVTLPIQLISFSAQSEENAIDLRWSTASELNFNYFSLEKSSDGKSFEEIAQVAGHGTTNEMHTYSFRDNNPLVGQSYYRLISVDFDGYTEKFPVISATYNGDKSFYISPNPSNGTSIGLNLNFENDSNATVTFYDNLGSSFGVYAVNGSGKIVPSSTLKSGVYLARYTSFSFTKTVRFTVK